MEKTIFINKEYILGSYLSPYAVSALVAINELSDSEDDELYIDCRQIGYVLFGRELTRRELDFISSGCKELISKEIIKIKIKLSVSSFIVNVAKINKADKKNFYVTIAKSEIRKIFNIDSSSNKFVLFKCFLNIIGTFDASKIHKHSGKPLNEMRFKVGNMNRELLASFANVEVTRMNRFIELLAKNQILYVIYGVIPNDPEFKDTVYGIYVMASFYSRYEDRGLCYKYARLYGFVSNEHNYKIDAINESRKYIQKYNSLVKGKEYPLEEVWEIYNYVKKWNLEKAIAYEKAIVADQKVEEPKYKSLEPFQKYKGLSETMKFD